MTATICTTGTGREPEFFTGDTLAAAAQEAAENRAGPITALDVTPIGGTHYHTVNRDQEPEKYWLAQLAHTMTDNEEYGWGETRAGARAHAEQGHTAQ